MGTQQYEPEERAISLGKILFILSFLCPYLIDYAIFDDFQHLVIYAPVWMFALIDGQIFGGPTPMALLLFFYWTPIVIAGYMAYRFAKGRFSSTPLYVLSIIICIAISVVFILPMATISMASYNGVEIYTTVIPFPIVPILSLLLIPFLRPKEIASPWKDSNETESIQDASENEQPWLD